MRIRTLFTGNGKPGAKTLEAAPEGKRGGLLHAVMLDGKGGLVKWDETGRTRTQDWDEIDAWEAERNKPALWLHLDGSHPYVKRWLHTNLAQANTREVNLMVDHLVDEDAEPKFRETSQGFLLVLKGVNYNLRAIRKDEYKDIFSSELEKGYELVPLNCWLQPSSRRLVTVRPGKDKLQGVEAYLRECEAGNGSDSLGLLLAELAMSVSRGFTRVIRDLTYRIAELEKDPFTQKVGFVLDELAIIRKQAIELESHMTPQHLALEAIRSDRTATAKFMLASAPIREPYDSPMPVPDRTEEGRRLRGDEADHPLDALNNSILVTKEYEDFASNVRERAAAVQASITSIATARVSRQSIILNGVATTMLPLTLVAAIVSVNIGGMAEGRDGPGFYVFLKLLSFAFIVVIAAFFLLYRVTSITLDKAEGERRKRRNGSKLEKLLVQEKVGED